MIGLLVVVYLVMIQRDHTVEFKVLNIVFSF